MKLEPVGGPLTQVLTIGLWNVEWATPYSPRGRAITQLLRASDPDIICLTESVTLLGNGPDVAFSAADSGYPGAPGRHKVELWSRHPIQAVDSLGHVDLPGGRFVRAAVGHDPAINVVAVCVPWAMAHVSNGRKDRRPWEDHLRYLDVLGSLLSALEPDQPTILLGDFNQRIPNSPRTASVARALKAAIPDWLHLHTAGVLPGADKQDVDHVFASRHLECLSVKTLPNAGVAGKPLSDHVGLVLQLKFASQ